MTHGFDEDQRFLPLSFSTSSGSLTIQAPANANLAPPGYYMLFLVNANGVPSIATFVHFDAPGADTIPPTPPTNLAGQGSVGSAALTWTAATDNTGVALYNVCTDRRCVGISAVHRQPHRSVHDDQRYRPGRGGGAPASLYLVTAQDVSRNVSDPSNEAAVIVFADTTAPSVAITAPQPQATVTGPITIFSDGL